jgi:transcriptional regulator with XRE-family HTH domain
MRAVIAYLSTLRQERGMTPPQAVAAMRAIGGAELQALADNYVWRVESGETPKPSAMHLLAFARAVGAQVDVLTDLILDTSADVDDGLYQAFVETVGPERAMALARQARAALEYEADAEKRRHGKSPRQERQPLQPARFRGTEEESAN